MKQFVRRILPPLLYDALRWCLRPEARHSAKEPIRFSGNYANWEEARRDSTGYDSPVILEQTRTAILKVKDGEAPFERDGVLLPTPEPPLQLLAGLLRAAADNNGRLHVLDFGGSLGSTYFQCRHFLRPVPALRWSVVEQPAHAACGAREFANDELQFFTDVTAAIQAGQPDVLILSGVLQFLPDPIAWLTSMLDHRIKYVLVDRTYFHFQTGHRLTVQHVPAWIYPASYPTWFFSESEFRNCFATHYELVADFLAHDEPILPDAYACAKGMIFRLKS